MYGATTRLSGRLGSHPGSHQESLEPLRTVPIPDLIDFVGTQHSIDATIQHLAGSEERVVGVAVTARCAVGDNYAVFGALPHLFVGSILVVDNRGISESCCGGDQVALEAFDRGAIGVLAYGTWRDLGSLSSSSSPVYGLGISNVSLPKSKPGDVNVPVAVGGAIVEPGDIVVLDREGCAVVPVELISKVLASLKRPQKPSQSVRQGIKKLSAAWQNDALSNTSS